MDKTKEAGVVGPQHPDDAPRLIQEIIRTHQVLLAEITRRTGMTSSRFALMRLLADADADIGVMELARQLGINAAAVTRQVQVLEGEGFVRRRADSNDGRRSGIRLSPRGRRLMDELLECSRGFEQMLSSALSAEEMASAAMALNKLRTFVEGLR
jgi:DNA-binding MarR family transcriptional regulator